MRLGELKGGRASCLSDNIILDRLQWVESYYLTVVMGAEIGFVRMLSNFQRNTKDTRADCSGGTS